MGSHRDRLSWPTCRWPIIYRDGPAIHVLTQHGSALPGVKLMTYWSQVRHPNHLTTITKPLVCVVIAYEQIPSLRPLKHGHQSWGQLSVTPEWLQVAATLQLSWSAAECNHRSAQPSQAESSSARQAEPLLILAQSCRDQALGLPVNTPITRYQQQTNAVSVSIKDNSKAHLYWYLVQSTVFLAYLF